MPEQIEHGYIRGLSRVRFANCVVQSTLRGSRLQAETMAFPIANLVTSSDNICTIRFYDTGASMRCFPTSISGYFATQVDGVLRDKILGHPRYKRAVRRGHETARRFQKLIGSVGKEEQGYRFTQWYCWRSYLGASRMGHKQNRLLRRDQI